MNFIEDYIWIAINIYDYIYFINFSKLLLQIIYILILREIIIIRNNIILHLYIILYINTIYTYTYIFFVAIKILQHNIYKFNIHIIKNILM